ncbi:MAG: hypothetical protein C4297_14095 [Gemmataceae bacterium]
MSEETTNGPVRPAVFQDVTPDFARPRDRVLRIALVVLVGGSFCSFLVFVTGGFFLWVLLVALALSLVGLVHYVLWGRSFEREIAQEREALLKSEGQEQVRQQMFPWERRYE